MPSTSFQRCALPAFSMFFEMFTPWPVKHRHRAINTVQHINFPVASIRDQTPRFGGTLRPRVPEKNVLRTGTKFWAPLRTRAKISRNCLFRNLEYTRSEPADLGSWIRLTPVAPFEAAFELLPQQLQALRQLRHRASAAARRKTDLLTTIKTERSDKTEDAFQHASTTCMLAPYFLAFSNNERPLKSRCSSFIVDKFVV